MRRRTPPLRQAWPRNRASRPVLLGTSTDSDLSAAPVPRSITSAASAICGTRLGETSAVASVGRLHAGQTGPMSSIWSRWRSAALRSSRPSRDDRLLGRCGLSSGSARLQDALSNSSNPAPSATGSLPPRARHAPGPCRPPSATQRVRSIFTASEHDEAARPLLHSSLPSGFRTSAARSTLRPASARPGRLRARRCLAGMGTADRTAAKRSPVRRRTRAFLHRPAAITVTVGRRSRSDRHAGCHRRKQFATGGIAFPGRPVPPEAMAAATRRPP